MVRNFQELKTKYAKAAKRKRMAVAPAGDLHTLEAVFAAQKAGLVEPVLVGDKKVIEKIAEELAQTLEGIAVYDTKDEQKACEYAVNLIRESKADFLLKGKVDTKVILKAVVDKENGLGTGKIMSHFTIFEIPTYKKLLVITDGGMITYPTLEQKRVIIENSVGVLNKLGYANPKVGVLACAEKVNPKMPETIDGEKLKEMNQKGEISGCVVEGPISYDCAISKEIADIKGYYSPVAGDVDILIAPDIHTGNIMGKMLTCTCGAKMAGFVVGAKCPIVLTSRGSSAEEKYLSILTSAMVSS